MCLICFCSILRPTSGDAHSYVCTRFVYTSVLTQMACEELSNEISFTRLYTFMPNWNNFIAAVWEVIKIIRKLISLSIILCTRGVLNRQHFIKIHTWNRDWTYFRLPFLCGEWRVEEDRLGWYTTNQTRRRITIHVHNNFRLGKNLVVGLRILSAAYYSLRVTIILEKKKPTYITFSSVVFIIIT